MTAITDYMPMYEGKDGSPLTGLVDSFHLNVDTQIKVRNGSVLQDAPNICTLFISAGSNADFAIIYYEQKVDNILSGLTVFYASNSDTTFPAGTFCSRRYAEYDQHAFIHNINMLYDLVYTMAEIIKPSATIEKFVVNDLPSVVLAGQSFKGEHTFLHKEKLIQFITSDLKLLENGTEKLSVSPTTEETEVTFTADLTFEHAGEYSYTLRGTDFRGNIVEKSQIVKVAYPLYVGHLNKTTLTETDLDSLTLCEECYDGMQVSLTTDNDYVWICIAKPSEIQRVSSHGFDVPMEEPQTLLAQQGEVLLELLCYRTTMKVISGMTHKFDLKIKTMMS